ncbi:unnamed protein product, partial [Tuber aestivum]
QAIKNGEEALGATPQAHPNRGGIQNTLGGMLFVRFEQLRARNDLQKGIERSENALATAPPDHSDLAAIYKNLENMLRT